MWLEHLFDGELRYTRDSTWIQPYGEVEWAGFADGKGQFRGERLTGRVQWVNSARRREDNVWLPDFSGRIETEDGARILFRMHGYNTFLTPSSSAILASMTYTTADDRYRWLNTVYAVVEAVALAPTGPEERDEPERVLLRAFACVNEVALGAPDSMFAPS